VDLVQRFEAARGHLRAVAYQMLGSLAEAEDAVQEAWLRLARSDVSGGENLTGWPTTVVVADWFVMEAVVAALLTVCGTAADELLLKTTSPP